MSYLYSKGPLGVSIGAGPYLMGVVISTSHLKMRVVHASWPKGPHGLPLTSCWARILVVSSLYLAEDPYG